ncbi:MAG: RNA-binding domain-containing protein [Candidatus Thorarchaeota archaeon]
MEVLITCPVNPTEDAKKVGNAIENLLGRTDFSTDDNKSEIVVTYTNRDSISLVRQTIHETRIIDAARRRLEANWNGTSTSLHFDKQAAFAKKLRIIDDNQELPPLGSIEMVAVFDSEQEYEEFVNWFTPPTKDGKIINH